MLNIAARRRPRRSRSGEPSRTGAPPPPPMEELVQIALAVPARRRGVSGWASRRPRPGVRLARANRYQDAYLLYQPYTFQNNAPFRRESATSWALGITVPLPRVQPQPGEHRAGPAERDPVADRAGGIERRVATEVQQAAKEYEVSGQIVDQIRTGDRAVVGAVQERPVHPLPERRDERRLLPGGPAGLQRHVKAYHRHGGSAPPQHAGLNTASGERLLP